MARNKVRKWSNLKGQVPDAPETQPSEWMQEVFKAKDARQTKSMDELQQEYGELVAADEADKAAASERNIKYAALDRRILEELEKVKQVSGQDMWRGNGHTFSPKFSPRPVVEDKQALRAWITETGQEDQLELPTGRLNAIIAECMNTDLAAILTPAQRATLRPGDPGSGMPPPGIKLFLQTSVHHTSAKAKPTTAASTPDADGDDGPF